MPELPPDPRDEQDLRTAIRDLQARVSALERGTGSLVPPSPRRPGVSPVGLTLVNRVGALTLAIGILFFFKYAADMGWIGPAARVIIGLVTGAGLVAASEWLNNHGQRVFSQGLAGCGLATLYISLYAATGFYQLLLPGFVFLLLIVLCAAVIAVAVSRRNPIIVLFGLFGALLIPLLIELTEPAAWRIVQAFYLLVLNLIALCIEAQLQSQLIVALTALLVALTALLRVESKNYWPLVLLLLALAVAHFFFSRTTAGRQSGVLRTRLQADAYAIGHCFIVIAAIRLIGAWTHTTATATTLASVLLALYGIALLSLGLAKNIPVDRALGLFFLGLVIAKLYLYDIWQLNYATRITAFVVLGILLLLASFIYGRTRSQKPL